jgi:hypothetical protein|tara:strand:+ start:37 stop:318 length:282 start_codon:yes stop_codon:yes gene_type:complete
MHLYYPFPDEASVITASLDIYDLNAPPRDERVTLYAFDWFPNSGNPTYVLAWEDEEQTFDTGDILDGITPLTEQEAIDAGYQLDDEYSALKNM